MRRFTLVLVLAGCFLASGCSSTASGKPDKTVVLVNRVIDGDTFEVKLDGNKTTVRLIGIDTPETKKPGTQVKYFGPEASAFTKKRLEQKEIRLEWDVERTDKYGRDLVYVWIGDELFNRTLVEEGYARIATFPPNVKYADLFRKAQQDARKRGKGVWKDYESAFDQAAPPSSTKK